MGSIYYTPTCDEETAKGADRLDDVEVEGFGPRQLDLEEGSFLGFLWVCGVEGPWGGGG